MPNKKLKADPQNTELTAVFEHFPWYFEGVVFTINMALASSHTSLLSFLPLLSSRRGVKEMLKVKNATSRGQSTPRRSHLLSIVDSPFGRFRRNSWSITTSFFVLFFVPNSLELSESNIADLSLHDHKSIRFFFFSVGGRFDFLFLKKSSYKLVNSKKEKKKKTTILIHGYE